MVSQLSTKFLIPFLLVIASSITIIALVLSWHNTKTFLSTPEYSFQTGKLLKEPLTFPSEYDYEGDDLSDPEAVGEDVPSGLSSAEEPSLSLVEPKSCLLSSASKKKTKMVLFVSSRPNDAEMRLSIRNTWGSSTKTCGVKLLFGFGAVNSDHLQEEIIRESKMFGDLLQIRHVEDSYRNQTRLVLAFYEWARFKCNQTEYVAKADDDTWINLPLVLSRLDSITDIESFIAGYWFPAGTEVMRNPEHAQYLSREERADDHYPAYCSGVLYVIPYNMVFSILQTAATMQMHWIDDAFITGLSTINHFIFYYLSEVIDFIAGDVITKINENTVENRRQTIAKDKEPTKIVTRYDLAGWLTLPQNQTTTNLCRLLLKSTIMHRVDATMKNALDNLSCSKQLHNCLN